MRDFKSVVETNRSILKELADNAKAFQKSGGVIALLANFFDIVISRLGRQSSQFSLQVRYFKLHTLCSCKFLIGDSCF